MNRRIINTIVATVAVAGIAGASSATAQAAGSSVSATPEVDIQHDYLVVTGNVSSKRSSCEEGRAMTLKQISNTTGEKKLIAVDESGVGGEYSMGNFIDRSATTYIVKAKATGNCDAAKVKFSI